MSGDRIVKHHDNGEITVVWKPDLCAHSTKCLSHTRVGFKG
jgi:hypothetical protein